MKILSSYYLDFEDNTTLNEQLNCLSQNSLQYLVLRSIGSKQLFSFVSKEIEEFSSQIKKSKAKIAYYDLTLEEYNINDTIKENTIFPLFVKTLDYLKILNIDCLAFNIPLFNDVVKEKELLTTVLNKYYAEAKKRGVTLVIKPNSNHESGVYAYVLKEIVKKGYILYNPLFYYLKKESSISSYRVLREYIKIVVLDDINANSKPSLLGYGEACIRDLFKRLNRDDYQSIVAVDKSMYSHLKKIVPASNKPKKGILKIFSKKPSKEYELIKKRISSNSNKVITYNDILEFYKKIIEIMSR
ncbi:MAG: hypothetical protein LBV51_05145 [Acholeplasmatales bacterium]|jgi:vacuolar-type H+-ATPase subunit F/Vma7|nr:hypothetical protein [Acholeplasmatales bacterium]